MRFRKTNKVQRHLILLTVRPIIWQNYRLYSSPCLLQTLTVSNWLVTGWLSMWWNGLGQTRCYLWLPVVCVYNISFHLLLDMAKGLHYAMHGWSTATALLPLWQHAESHMLTHPGRDHTVMLSKLCHLQNKCYGHAYRNIQQKNNILKDGAVGGDRVRVCSLYLLYTEQWSWKVTSTSTEKNEIKVLKLNCWHIAPKGTAWRAKLTLDVEL